MVDLVPLETIEAALVEALLDRAFGTDRHARTAYRLRDGADPIAGLSLAAIEHDVLVGTIQCWPVGFAADDGATTSMILVGPVAVDPSRQRDGLGRTLMTASLRAADTVGLADALMLIGDPDYYGRFFGFTADRTAGWRLPGPVDRHRLLARGAGVPAGSGLVVPQIVGHV